MLYPGAITATLEALVAAASSCLELEPCDLAYYGTKVQPPPEIECAGTAIQVVVDRIRNVRPNDDPGCCMSRTLVEFKIVIDLPLCPADEQTGVRSVANVMADAVRNTDTIAHILWGLNAQGRNGSIAGSCNDVTFGDTQCTWEGLCAERWELGATVDLTGWCPPAEAPVATAPRIP